MTKLTLDNLVNLENQTSTVATINNNSASTVTALENTLSRDGTTPNSMGSSLDMNGFRVLNIAAPANPTDLVRKQDLTVITVANTTQVPAPGAADATKIVKIDATGAFYSFSGLKIDATNNITPTSVGAASVGTGALSWQNLFLNTAGVINFNNGNYTITHATNKLVFNKAIDITVGPLTVLSGNVALTAGNVALTSGNVTLTAGNVALTSGNVALTLGNVSLTNGFVDLAEIAAPAIPAVNVGRIYVRDNATVTNVYHKDFAGTETRLDVPYASTAEMKAFTATERIVTPAQMFNHPGMPKAWAKVTGGTTPTMVASYGFASVSRPALGRLLFTLTTTMTSVNYVIMASGERTATGLAETQARHFSIRNATQTASTFEVDCYDGTAVTNVAIDATAWHIVVWGDQ